MEQMTEPETIPGTQIKISELRERGVPEDLIAKIPEIVAKTAPRKVGLAECNGKWFVYRSVSRREFRNLVRESTERVAKQAQNAQKAGTDVNPAILQADSIQWMEEQVACMCSVLPKITREEIAADAWDAGIPKMIHDAVLSRSSFEQTSDPIML